MSQATPITSAQIKKFASLKQKKYRDAEHLFIAEGIKICEELLKSKYKCKYLIYDSMLSEKGTIDHLIELAQENNISLLSAHQWQINSIASTSTPQGVIAIGAIPENKIDFNIDSFVGFENIQDPGNLGTNIRSAYWFGINNIIISKNSVDIYNTKTIRSTMGNLFHLNVIYVEDIIEYCKINFPTHKLYAASLDATMELSEIITPSKYGLIFGNESKGLTQDLLNKIENKYIIKGNKNADSLNLAISVGISLYHFTLGKIIN